MTTRDSIEYLGNEIAENGIPSDPTSLSLLASAARDLGVNDVLVDVMVDDHEPENARVRAFARVSTTVSTALRDGFVPRVERELAPAC
ncbi:MAG: hypothetical protein WCP95_10950 [Actinomycetes bacterium]